MFYFFEIRNQWLNDQKITTKKDFHTLLFPDYKLYKKFFVKIPLDLKNKNKQIQITYYQLLNKK